MALWLLAPAAGLADYPDEGVRPDLDGLKERIETGDERAAEGELRALLDTLPGDADILNLLGYANRKLGRYDDARALYVRALTLNPRH